MAVMNEVVISIKDGNFVSKERTSPGKRGHTEAQHYSTNF